MSPCDLPTSKVGALPSKGWKYSPSWSDCRQTAWTARNPVPPGSGAVELVIVQSSMPVAIAGVGKPPAAATSHGAVPPEMRPPTVVKLPMLKRIFAPSPVHAGSSTSETLLPRRQVWLVVEHDV